MSTHRDERQNVRRRLSLSRVIVMGAMAAGGVALGGPGHGAAEGRGETHATHAGPMAMTEGGMRRWTERGYAAHPPVGERSAAPPAATFTVTSFRFDKDGSATTQVDTARIQAGETVLWQWVGGSHTVTNGTGAADPQAGTLFDQPSNSSTPQFSYLFTTAGTFPFFCRFHVGMNMKGVVIVMSPSGVEPVPGDGTARGVLGGPWPNPTRAGVSLRFALGEPGRTRIEVFDAQGRLVTVAWDRELAAGAYAAGWDGRRPDGTPADAGVYYLRLLAPGLFESRRIVIAR